MKSIIISLLFMIGACTSPPDPLNTLVTKNNHYPEITIVLSDIDPDSERMEFSVTVGKPKNPANPKELTFVTETPIWMEVSSKFYEKYLSDLGMVIYTKRGNVHSATPQPRGYDRVGNSNYGEWRTDSSGLSFWEFYGMYSFMSNMTGSIYRNDYNSYQDHYRSGRPYYGSSSNGSGNKYGTSGTVTAKQKSTFSSKMKNRGAAKQNSFKNKLQQRKNNRSFSTKVSPKPGSSMSGTRGGSGRGGK